MCRRKWKTIIQDYIRSPHAESMRKRNQVVFSMLEAEAEYVQQLHILVNNFLRPLRMAASSKKPSITHDDVSSIFLNSETIMFLHQIFYQGLKARIASWPTLVLADLFDILLPMLNIYQEFVRNHQYSLQILAHCKQNRDFDKLLKQYEAKPDCEERTLETFLTYPMFQIPRYILTLHELLAHTPHEHVERNSLEYAKSKLEELSRIMHDEVSETENIRKNLAIERMIVEGCEILLDTSQTFVRQGNGVISLIDCTLMEEPEGTDEESKPDKSGQDMEHLDFKIVVEPKDTQSFTVILVASSRQEKSAWTSDISQASSEGYCIDNIRCNGLMMNAFEENSKVTVPQMIKSDTSLYCDDVDIRFSKMMNSCKVLQIRYASVERLLERLTDLRFLSIDFLNTFLHSYRVFTTAEVVLDKLITIYKKPISAIPARSLELFFASSQNNKLLYGEPPKSPRASRKFSSPPPLSITKTSSPNRRRKLSLNIPIITGGKALDLAALSCSSNGYASMYSSMSPAEGVQSEPFDNHSALEIAEQLTLLDHLVFKGIPYEEFFGQGWMKPDKNERTPYIMKTTKHFNHISNLIASEILRSEDVNVRVTAVEKWVAVADICRCLHNYNAVLEITSSLNRSAIFRLKKTWLKVSKQTKALIDKLQKLVSSEGRFKNLREALKNCDPPCVPYLGMYLTDLAFIEEGTPNYTEDGLVNFSKMRMVII
ncbi:Ras-specific guanine nucleotide-releasing factor 1 [Acipenser ruthenus]|uniref:Ras-specific guanine nucleotide-releasing factor 1 n=1 Tax=Acipenser ruthenus TaxID=7906 RepID=A0A444USQ2_ACIRT|nr:Ras-specific guanine nucleotide-releasing factor 1 [Acipenser ruthenus]